MSTGLSSRPLSPPQCSAWILAVLSAVIFVRAFIDASKHLVLKSAHPSPLSAHNGFFGCRHFSKANDWLAAHGETPIEW